MRIIALIDGSLYTASVCDHAAWVAGRSGASLELMHVIGRRETASAPSNLSGSLSLGARTALLEELSTLDEERGRLAQKRGRAILELAMEHLSAAGVVAGHRMRIGDLISEIDAVQDEFDVLVLGKRGEAADFATMHLGSNLERVLRSTRKPVLVASRAFKPIETVLIAFDGGPSSSRAVEAAASDPLFRGLTIRVVTVGAEGQHTRERLDWAKAKLEAAGLAATTEILSGDPEHTLGREVENGAADLLVLGSHGHSRVRHLLIGSNTTALVRSCKAPIMIYR